MADPELCPLCEHPRHDDAECDAQTGYDHLNGDHECGCPGPLAVACPDCAAPAGTPCRMGDPDGPELHADRITAGEHAGMTIGVCEACGLPAAPPLGCPAHGYTAVVELSPEVENREPVPGPVCPECRAGKHPNCDGAAWDQAADAPARCACADLGHPGS